MRNWKIFEKLLLLALTFVTSLSIANSSYIHDSKGFLTKETVNLSEAVLERLDKVYNFRTVVLYTPEGPVDKTDQGQQLWLAGLMRKVGAYDLYLVITTVDLRLYSNLNRDRSPLFDRKDLNQLLHFFQEMHVREKPSRALLQGVHQIEATLSSNVSRAAKMNVLTRETVLQRVTPLGVWLGFSLGLLFSFLVIYFQANVFRSSWITALKAKMPTLISPATETK